MDFLVVDDDKTFRDATCFLIDGEGHYAEGVATGEQALTTIKEEKFDTVLLDLNLPKVSGLEVLRRIKSDPVTRRIPVVILAMSRRDHDIIECSRLGAENYMIKPVSFDGFCKLTPLLSLRWALLDQENSSGSAR